VIILGDVVRTAAMAVYAAVIVSALRIVMRYYVIYRRDRDRWIGLLPQHVVLIGMSYITFATGSIAGSIERWGHPLTPFSFINLFAGALGIGAIRTMNHYQGKRMFP